MADQYPNPMALFLCRRVSNSALCMTLSCIPIFSTMVGECFGCSRYCPSVVRVSLQIFSLACWLVSMGTACLDLLSFGSAFGSSVGVLKISNFPICLTLASFSVAVPDTQMIPPCPTINCLFSQWAGQGLYSHASIGLGALASNGNQSVIVCVPSALDQWDETRILRTSLHKKVCLQALVYRRKKEITDFHRHWFEVHEKWVVS